MLSWAIYKGWDVVARNKCIRDGHKWKVLFWGRELPYWECRRWGCRSSKMAPWYAEYRRMNGLDSGRQVTVDGPYPE